MKYLKQPALNSLDEFSWVNPKADLLSAIIWILSYKIAHKIRERIICHDMREKKQIDTRGEDEMKKKKKTKKKRERKTKQNKTKELTHKRLSGAKTIEYHQHRFNENVMHGRHLWTNFC